MLLPLLDTFLESKDVALRIQMPVRWGATTGLAMWVAALLSKEQPIHIAYLCGYSEGAAFVRLVLRFYKQLPHSKEMYGSPHGRLLWKYNGDGTETELRVVPYYPLESIRVGNEAHNATIQTLCTETHAALLDAVPPLDPDTARLVSEFACPSRLSTLCIADRADLIQGDVDRRVILPSLETCKWICTTDSPTAPLRAPRRVVTEPTWVTRFFAVTSHSTSTFHIPTPVESELNAHPRWDMRRHRDRIALLMDNETMYAREIVRAIRSDEVPTQLV